MDNAHRGLWDEIRTKKALDDALRDKVTKVIEEFKARFVAELQPAAAGKANATPSLIDIRRRIRSVKNTQQITKAMKMVSAAKLRRAQDRVIAARPYGAMLRKVLANVAAAVGQRGGRRNPLLAQRPEKRILLVLVTSDKGLAGAFNTNLIKAAQRFAAEHPGASVRWC